MNALTFFPTESVAEQVSSIFQSKKMEVEPERVCTQCGSTDTPLWRRGPHGPKSMCNRCGIRWKRKEDKKAGKKPNSNKNKKKESTTTTPKPKKIRTTASDREYLSSSLSPSHDSDSWLSELDDEDEMELFTSRAKVTMGSPRSEPTYVETKEPQITVNLTPQGESFTVDDDATFARPEVPEPRRLSRDFINVNTSLNYRNDTEPHSDGMSLRKRKAKARSSDFDYEWNVPSGSPSRRKSRQELLQEVRNLPSAVKIFLEEAEAELQKIQKQENENAEITRLNQVIQRMASEMTELRQSNMQKDAIISSMKEHQMQQVQQVPPVSFLPGFRSFGGALFSNTIPLLPQQVQRVNLLPQSC